MLRVGNAWLELYPLRLWTSQCLKLHAWFCLQSYLAYLVKGWNSVIQSGSWLGPKAGGCRNFPTFANNPQFQIYLDEDDDGDGKCSCLIALMQKNRRKQKKMGVQDLCIGFSVYKVHGFVIHYVWVLQSNMQYWVLEHVFLMTSNQMLVAFVIFDWSNVQGHVDIGIIIT